MALPSFTLTGDLFEIGNSVIDGAITAIALAKARVVFTSNLPEDRFVAFAGDEYWPPSKVYAEVNSVGTILADGYPVKLLANDSDLNVSGIQWTMHVLIPVPGGTQRITQTFLAPQDGDSVDLSNIIPVTPADPTYTDTPGFIDGGDL